MFSQMFMLPPLVKKVIYLDQFALSNVMKALNPNTDAYKRGMDPFWLTLFKKLYSLSQYQMIICPNSEIHEKESRVSSYFTALRRINELLSGQVSFRGIESIRNRQIYEHVRDWIKGKTHTNFSFDREVVLDGEIDGWTSPIYPSVTMPWQPEWIENLRKARGELHREITDIFARWQTQTDKTFKFWFDEEIRSYGINILAEVRKYNLRLNKVLRGEREPQLIDLVQPPAFITYFVVLRELEASGVKAKDLGQKIVEYFTSPALTQLPFLRIASMIWASVARKAAAGMKKLPSQGLSNDVDAISTLLPYCDAMFIDNECRAYFLEEPLRSLNVGTQLFSISNKNAFLEYLDAIESSISEEQLQLIRLIYGEGWAEPFTTVFTGN